MSTLKAKWEASDGVVKAGVAAGAVLVAIVFVVKLLPYLVGAMGVGLLIALLFVPYWAPTIIAFIRKHPSKTAVLALNFFFGWTFIGWVAALVWALSDNSARGAPQSVVVHTTVNPNISVNSSPPPPYRVDELLNGHRFDGTRSIPAEAAAPQPPPSGE